MSGITNTRKNECNMKKYLVQSELYLISTEIQSATKLDRFSLQNVAATFEVGLT
jgi:hypothetical protein